MTPNPPRSPPPTQPSPANSAPPEEAALDSRTLFTGGRAEVAIRHNGRIYRLRCTRLGKLILTA